MMSSWIYKYPPDMDNYINVNNRQSARQLIAGIANEYIELSHDKARWQRDDIVKRCQAWLKANPVKDDNDKT